jgi:iron complex outermembrane receptor protein
MRLQALWKPVDAASLLAGADYAHMGGNGAGFVYKPQPAGTSPWEGVTSGASNAQLNQAVVAAGLCAPAVAFPPGVAPTGACPPLPVGPGVSLPQVALFAPLNGGRKQDNKLWGVHAELNWDLGGTTLTILPAYRYSSETYTTLPTYPFYQAPAESRETTVEARLSGTTQRLKWVGGLYYFNEAQSYTSGVDAGLVQNVRYEVAPHTLSYAAFGQSTLSFTDNWRVITGVRFTSDERTINGQTFTVFPAVSLNPAAICLNPTEAFCLAESYQGHRTFDNMSWKIGLEHDVSDQSLLFVTASTGFKAGGFNQNVANSPAGSNAAQPYSPEKLLAFELGSKNRFLDQRLQVNVEGFYWRYTDHQEPHVLIDGLGNAAFQFSNAGRATMYGLDVDLQFKVASSDTVRLLVEAIAARYDSFEYTSAFQVNTGCGETSAAVYHINCSGFQMAHVSKWSGTASYSHHFDFGARGRVDLDLDGQYASARWLQIEFVPAERAPGYITGNVSLTYRPEAASWSISGYCRNVVDKAIYMSGNANAFGPALFGANIAPPRIFGARVRFDF